MNKKTIVGALLALSALSVVGCNNTTAHNEQSAAPEMTQTYVNQITRDYLLSTERLNTVDGASIEQQAATETQALKKHIESAQDGDTITIPNGKYADLGVVNVTANNVTIKSEEAGGAWLTGLVQLKLTGDDITLDGLVFTEGGPAERFGGVRMMGDRNTLQNSTFYYFNHDYEYLPDERRSEYPKYLWLSLWGKDGKVINNRFEGKQKRGTLIGVQKDETPDNHLIANNIFLDQKPNQYNEFDIEKAIRYNGNSWEAIRIGDSKSSQWPSQSRFVDNLMIDMDGERELISIKSGENEISGNTIVESTSLISLRHGKANRVENNVILGNEKRLTGGIRIYDEDHVIANNYIAGTRGRDGVIEGNADLRGGIVINTGIIDVKNGEVLDQSIKGKELNKQWTPKNITIKNNTLADTEWGIVYGNQSHRVSLFNNDEVEGIFAGVDVHFSDNVVDNSANPEFVSVRATTEFPLKGAQYQNEFYSNTVVNEQLLGEFSAILPKAKEVNGLTSYEGAGADVRALKIVTAETAGPDYELVNTVKEKS